ncbi:hypothetical protein C8Q77DRAFT_928483 [Trametes polyzona]|nr:hypothetical protein C8Q77DRAFT_928483 [Trametes polyzona]
MFFCRHHLLRAPAQRHFASLFTTRNALSHTVRSSIQPRPSHVRCSHSPSTPPTTQSVPEETRVSDTASTSDAPDRLASCALPESTVATNTTPSVTSSSDGEPTGPQSTSVEEDARKPKVADAPLEAYLVLRNALDTLSSETFAAAVHHCLHTSQWNYFPMFIQDAIWVLDNRPSKIRGRIMIEKLLDALTHKALFQKADILALLLCLQRHDQLRFLSTRARVTTARALVSYPPDELDRELFDILAPLLVERVGRFRASDAQQPDSRSFTEPTINGPRVPRVVWPLYAITVRFALWGDRQNATDLLKTLVEHQMVDTRAIQETDLSSPDLVYLTASVLSRTCLRYGWYQRATRLLLSVMGSSQEVSPPLAKLAVDWVGRALSLPRENDVEHAYSVLVTLLRRSHEYAVPNQVLQLFYDTAFEHHLPRFAAKLYAHSRSSQHGSYPPPLDTALLKLLLYLESESRNVHLARQLVEQVVDEQTPIPVHARAPFIAATAALGLATHARALWERFAEGRDAQFVVGNGVTMLRIVSLFSRVADLSKAAAERKLARGSGARRENRENDSSDDQEDVDQPTASRTLSQDQDLPPSDAPSSPAAPLPPPDPDAQEPPLSDGSDASADANEREEDRTLRVGFNALTVPELLAREADLRAFADRVYDAYYQSKLPLENATHQDLTSLARGASLLGRDSTPLHIFTLMKQRGMELDMHDINLGLTVLARRNYMAGVAYLQRMLDSDLKPDAVSFGTVIHWAAHHGDADMVTSLLTQAREAGVEELTFKTLASLLHQTVVGKISESLAPDARLLYVQKIVDILLDRGIEPPPNVGRDCVVAALGAGDAAQAYHFWRRLLRGKVDARDGVQIRLRGTVASLVRQRLREGVLDPNRGAVMLYDLGYHLDAFRISRYSPASPHDERTRDKGYEPAADAFKDEDEFLADVDLDEQAKGGASKG